MKRYFKTVEFWILIFFLVRLIGISNPPLEIGHNWRQSTGLMVARNFVEVDANILYPRVDENNGETGIIGMEFPSLNYLYFLLAKIFGYTHWYGRLINLIISTIGIWYFSRILKLLRFNDKTVFASTLFLLTSIWFSFSRKMMPDTYCISIMFVALFYCLKFFEENKAFDAVLYVIFCSLAILSKISAIIYLFLLVPAFIYRKYPLRSGIIIAGLTILPLALTYLWYYVWNPFLADKYGNWYNIGKSLSEGFSEIVKNPLITLDNFYFDAFSGYLVFILFLIGIIVMVWKKEKMLTGIFISISLIFMLYIIKSGHFFYQHNYYIIPYVPIMALVAGYAVSKVSKKWVFITIIVLGAVEGIANQQHELFIRESMEYKMTLESIMDEVSAREDLIMINGNGNPQMIYLSHRKGWNCFNSDFCDSLFISNAALKNCKLMVVDKHVFSGEIDLALDVVFENADFKIFELR